jgi:hypothetical protein
MCACGGAGPRRRWRRMGGEDGWDGWRFAGSSSSSSSTPGSLQEDTTNAPPTHHPACQPPPASSAACPYLRAHRQPAVVGQQKHVAALPRSLHVLGGWAGRGALVAQTEGALTGGLASGASPLPKRARPGSARPLPAPTCTTVARQYSTLCRIMSSLRSSWALRGSGCLSRACVAGQATACTRVNRCPNFDVRKKVMDGAKGGWGAGAD